MKRKQLLGCGVGRKSDRHPEASGESRVSSSGGLVLGGSLLSCGCLTLCRPSAVLVLGEAEAGEMGKEASQFCERSLEAVVPLKQEQLL